MSNAAKGNCVDKCTSGCFAQNQPCLSKPAESCKQPVGGAAVCKLVKKKCKKCKQKGVYLVCESDAGKPKKPPQKPTKEGICCAYQLSRAVEFPAPPAAVVSAPIVEGAAGGVDRILGGSPSAAALQTNGTPTETCQILGPWQRNGDECGNCPELKAVCPCPTNNTNTFTNSNGNNSSNSTGFQIQEDACYLVQVKIELSGQPETGSTTPGVVGFVTVRLFLNNRVVATVGISPADVGCATQTCANLFIQAVVEAKECDVLYVEVCRSTSSTGLPAETTLAGANVTTNTSISIQSC